MKCLICKKCIERIKNWFSCKKEQDVPMDIVTEDKKENAKLKLHFLSHPCDCYLRARTVREVLNIDSNQWEKACEGVSCRYVNRENAFLDSGNPFGWEKVYNMKGIKEIANRIPNVSQKLLNEIESQYRREMQNHQYALM